MAKQKYVRSGYVMDGLFIHHIDVNGIVVASYDAEDKTAVELLNIYPLGGEIIYYDDYAFSKVMNYIVDDDGVIINGLKLSELVEF